MTPISLFVAGVPQPQGSTKAFARKDGGRPIVTSDNAKNAPWRAVLAYELAQHVDGVTAKVPMEVHLDFYFLRPASHPKRNPPPHITKPDLDKLIRSFLDAGTKVVWADDSQVMLVSASKQYAKGDNPRCGVRIHISEFEGEIV